MTIILVLGTTYIVVDQMNSLSQRLGQDRTTSDALALAKEALIGHSANNANRPGALLCPDTNNDGNAEATCASANERVGRLPWKTLGLPDLRDASGERLWYALSDAFRDTGILNSNTMGQLLVHDGLSDAVTNSTVVALIIAPGATLSGQTRSLANENTVPMYLEARNSDAEASNVEFVQARPSAKYPRGSCLVAGLEVECNDRLLLVTHQDLFSVVENMVAKRLEIDIAPLIRSYFTTFGAYPFPRSFADPDAAASTTWTGTAGNTSGQLPMTTSKNMFTWVTGAGAPTIAVTDNGATIAGGVDAPSCAASTANLLSCSVTYKNGAPRVTITARVAGIGRGFSMFEDPITHAMGTLNLNHFKDHGNQNTLTDTGIGSTASHVVTAGALNADGSQTITYAANLKDEGGWKTRNMELDRVRDMDFPNDPPFISQLTQPGYSTDWYIRNKWYKLVLYAVASSFAPGGSGSCTLPSDNCFTVTNLTGSNNKRAILVFAGRTIGAQNRTVAPGAVASYVEGENINANPAATLADRTYEQTPRSTAINDKLVVVAP